MKALIAVALGLGLTLSISLKAAATPLDIGGKITMGAGAGLVGWDIYKIGAATKVAEDARAKLASSKAFQGLVDATKELRAAEAELGAFVQASPEGQTGSILARIVQAEGQRDQFLREVLERDIAAYNLLGETPKIPAGLEEQRAKAAAEMQENLAKAKRFSKYRKLGGIGLFVGGTVIVFMTVSESTSELETSALFDRLPREARAEMAYEIENFVYPQHLTLEEIFDGIN